jgi:hypothetical protein
MRNLEQLPDSLLDIRYRVYLHRYEMSGGTKYGDILEVLKRERGRRYHMRRRPKTAAERARGEAAQRSAAINFAKGANAANRR